jgi:hypothetical protein
MSPAPDRRHLQLGPFAMDRRRFLLTSSGALVGLGLFGCSGSDDSSDAGPDDAGPSGDLAAVLAAVGSAGLVDEDLYQRRIDEYLAHATASDHADDPVGIAAHLVRAHREPDHRWNVGGVSEASLAERFERIDGWLDTRDFDLMYLTWVLALADGETDATTLPPALIDAMEQRFLANRYRYDDPLPDGRLDELWFWSENHLIIGYAIEHLAGQRHPDTAFAVTGMTGAEHRDRARADILEWVHERAELGFFEWHSNVYMRLNITPLLMLAELSEDPEVIAAAAIGLDLCLLDVAGHTHNGCYTAPRGRTYKKDKMSSLDENTFDTAKFLFDDTDAGYQSGADAGATYFCAARRYRPPQVVVDIATASGPSVVRERHGVFFDDTQPLTENPEAPHGKDFRDQANLPFWWSLGAVGMWPLAHVGVETADEFRLWETELFSQVDLMASLNDYDPDRIRDWLHPRTAAINFGYLGEANTYAYRDDKVSLATVVDHRPGAQRDQAHAWQAAIDEHAMVFTNHPITEPAESTDWSEDGRPGYWTGEAAMPRSAQFERTAVHLYLPAWDESTDPLVWSVLGYRPYTHAYVPQDHFDQVVQTGNWTVAGKDGAYIALWSWRTPSWRTYDPAVLATRDMVEPFDLVAEGGPDNVWLVEVATDADHRDLEAFVAALTAAEPDVTRDDDGFTVAWTSPSSGPVEFSSTGAFRVDGRDQPLGDFPRHDSPWGTVDHLATSYALDSGTATWSIDADGWARDVS